MNLVEDFRHGAPSVRPAGDDLLDCFQEALGHQLPNQFVAIQGLAGLLAEAEGARLSAEGREHLARLTALARRTARLVQALADIGRLCRDARSGGPVHPAEVAREAVAEVRLRDGATDVTLHFPSSLPAMLVSRQSLGQVLVQLVGNAVRAARESLPAAGVRVGGRALAEGVELWVADDGPGLPDLPPELLFAPFQRGEGLGLGLFLVRQVAAAWRGRLRVESHPGEGTCFTLLIPSPPSAPSSRTSQLP